MIKQITLVFVISMGIISFSHTHDMSSKSSADTLTYSITAQQQAYQHPYLIPAPLNLCTTESIEQVIKLGIGLIVFLMVVSSISCNEKHLIS